MYKKHENNMRAGVSADRLYGCGRIKALGRLPWQLQCLDWGAHHLLKNRRTMPPPSLTTLAPLTDLELRPTAPLSTTLLDPDLMNDVGEEAT